ncbi:ATP-binding protein [Variovorax sp. LjRoot175]|uniref:ATP-binding protein n=1 Tax=Variovorax sp. LjRoot175 TaxID=3342276 RepID=UPI003ED0B1C9
MSALETLENWLRSEYASQLNVSLSSQLTPGAVAVWQYADSSPETASLFDLDLGVWFKFVEISESTKVAGMVNESVQKALSDSAQLLWKTGIPEQSQDSRGTWTITLVFVIQMSCRADWEQAVQNLRAESGFTEEFSIDLVVFDNLSTLGMQLSQGLAMPRLLLASRRLLRLPPQEIESWLSADAEVKRLLGALPDRFASPQEKKLVEAMVKRVTEDTPTATSKEFPARPVDLKQINIKRMRNISDFSLALQSSGKPVVAHIIHGPNGTGKSSIFEGLSFAVSGSSRRMVEYLADTDIYRPVAANYIKNVLTPLDGSQAPQIEANGNNSLLDMPADEQDAEQRLVKFDGNLLAQEDARNFVETAGRKLGTRVLSGYSVLAQSLQSFCEREYNQANSRRQAWLREFGIAASVTKEESRLTKLVDNFIGRYYPQGTQQIEFWLDALAQRIMENSVEARSLAFDWKEADSKAKRDDLGKIIVQLNKLGADAECERAIYGWLERRNKVLARMALLRQSTARASSEIAQQRSEIEEDLVKWQRWLQRERNPEAEVTTKGLSAPDGELNKRLLVVKALGLSLAEHQQHLKQVQGTFLSSWASTHPDTCPTCNANHADAGGIVIAVAQLTDLIDRQLVATRKDYSEILSQLRELQKANEQLGQCPVSEERRIAVGRLLGFTAHESLESLLKEQNSVGLLLRSLDLLISPPELPLIEDTTVAAKRVWNAIEVENAKGAALWTLPDQWSRIKDLVDKECLGIIQHHLPRTLQAVWTEIAMTMTPARWNLSDQPRLVAESKRGSENLKIAVGNDKRQIGVRHIFNQAENHVLGLAWFFTRYLSSGRFRHSLVALDDPAQEMDQTTFRSFTRLLQTFCRLHERYDQSLTLVLFLHQEDRALDAARATNHQVTSLRWAKEIASAASVEQLILIGPEFKAPLPKPLQASAVDQLSTSS